ncbi:MAG TPA: hypothetical protein VH720_11245, partial [Candidatus Limnocylindrales bacterium]
MNERRPAGGDAVPVRQSGPDAATEVGVSAYVCEAVSCLSRSSHEVLTELGAQIAERGISGVDVKRVGCLRLCAEGPLVQVPQTGELFSRVRPDGVATVVDALAARTPDASRTTRRAFFDRQVPIATENSGRIDPESLDDYLGAQGYGALRRAITTMTPAEVREEITTSGLRGRGGAGYPTGLKWNTVAKATGFPR